MRRILTIARLNLLELVRDKGELVSVIVLPLILTWFFGTALGSGSVERPMSVPVADLDGSTYSASVVAGLEEVTSLDIVEVTERDARRRVDDREVAVAIVIPEGFGRAIESSLNVQVGTIVDPGSDRASAVLEVLGGVTARIASSAEAARLAGDVFGDASETSFRRRYEQADAAWEPPPVDVVVSNVSATGAHAAELAAPSNTQYSLGFTVFFVFMIALGSAGGVLEDRELGTLRRVLAAPVTRFEVLAGKVLGVAAVAGLEAALLVGFGAVVFGVPWGNEPVAVAVLVAALVFAATGLGVMVSALVRTRSQMSAIGPVLSTALAMIGGCYWPIEITSPFMQTLAKFTPTGWAMVGFKDVVARGGGVESALLPAAILMGFSVVALAVGVIRLKLE